jgi:hypothetical protein
VLDFAKEAFFTHAVSIQNTSEEVFNNAYAWLKLVDELRTFEHHTVLKYVR